MPYPTSRHRRSSETCGGELTVFVTPTEETDRHGKAAVYVGITRSDGLVWEPSSPIWISPFADPGARQTRRDVADAAVGFFEAACGAEENPAHRPTIAPAITDVRQGHDLIAELHAALKAADDNAARKLHDAYRVARPHRREEVAAFVQAFIEALNQRAPDGFAFVSPTGDANDLGWWPIES